jgi:hypothetical protein
MTTTHKRVAKAIHWCTTHLSKHRATPLHNTLLESIFGNRHRPLAKHLHQSLLLKQSDSYEVGKRSKAYYLNETGVDSLCREYGISATDILEAQVDWLHRTGLQEQLQSGNFRYEDKTYRLWNPLQSLRKAARNSILNGYGYNQDYDIAAAAPTLLTQYYIQVTGKSLPALTDYVAHSDEVRTLVANEVGASSKEVKQVITAMLFGARTQCLAFTSLKNTTPNLAAIVSHPTVQKIDTEMQTLRQALEPDGMNLAHRYFMLERDCINTVVDLHLENNLQLPFLIHDGWMSKPSSAATVVDYTAAIRRQTGYDVTLSHVTLQPLVADTTANHSAAAT